MLITIITPAHPEKTQYLVECANSIDKARSLLKTKAIDIEWCLSFDGKEPVGLKNDIVKTSDTLISRSSHKGISHTRNDALYSSNGEWVIPLDADDLLHPDFINFCEYLQISELAWVGANRVLMSEEKTPHWNNFFKVFPRGELASTWSSPFIFHHNSIAIRREVLLKVGGWPIIEYNEDMALAMLVNELYSGEITPLIMNYYRVWDGQEVQSSDYLNKKSVMFERIETLINTQRANKGIKESVKKPITGEAYEIKSS